MTDDASNVGTDPVSDFLTSLRVGKETRMVEGAEIHALTDETYLRVRALRDKAASEAKPDDRMSAYQLAERAAMLHYGVRTPALPFAQWKYELRQANTGKITRIIDAIKELSGIEDAEAQLAKKLLGRMADASENSDPASDTSDDTH